MYKSIFCLVILSFLVTSCKKEQDPFLIQKQNIGLLTDSTQVKDLKNIYATDSIVKYVGGDEFTGNINDIEIYEKGGKKLLVLSPSAALDSTATISDVRILDPRFKTEKGITSLSTFKDIKAAYKVTKIDNLLSSVVVTVNDINASFTIDKKELPANLRFDMNLKIEETQIPDKAKVKFFFINWHKIY
jgi:hypothetical protein